MTDITKLSDEELKAIGGKSTQLQALPDDVLKAMAANPDLRAKGTLDYNKLIYSPTVGMGETERTLAGVGKSITDSGRGVGQVLGVVSGADVRNARQLDRPLMATTAGQVGNTLGTVGMTLLPGAALKAAGPVLRAAGNAGTASAASAAGGALLAPNTIGSGLVVGGGMGLIQPAENMDERLGNMKLGALGGAAIPATLRAGSTMKAFLEPLYEGGQKNIIGRTIQRAAGGQDVGPALSNAAELVPGSQPTVGQASGNAGVAALERAASATNPEVTTAYSQRMAQQNQARVDAVRDMAGTTGERDFHAAARDQVANDLYSQAFSQGIDPSALTSGVKGEITKLVNRPSVQDAIDTARRLAKEDGKKLGDPSGSLEGLHYVKKALDDQMKGLAPGSNELRLVRATQDRLLTLMDRLSPAYAEARLTFKNMSAPINQMDVAQEVANKSIRPLDDVMQPASYARALNDQTAATATGFRGSTLENTMTPEQLNKLNAVKEDLARADFAKNAGRGAGSDTAQKMAYTNLMELSGIPTWLKAFGPGQVLGNLSSRAGDVLYGQANKDLSRKLAETMLDPKAASKMLESLAPGEREKVAKMLLRGMTPVGMSAPALVNSQK